VDLAGSGSYPLAAFSISGVQPLVSPTREFINNMDRMKIGFDDELDRTGSGSCPVVGFSISDVELSGSAAREIHVVWVPRGLRHSGLTKWSPSVPVYVCLPDNSSWSAGKAGRPPGLRWVSFLAILRCQRKINNNKTACYERLLRA
jgi:hypothetical protein